MTGESLFHKRPENPSLGRLVLMSRIDFGRYNGPLSLKEIARGFMLCTQNAEDLLDDAEVLINKGSYGHACALVILSEEEIAKCLMLATAATLDESDKISWMKFWRGFRKHKAKQDDLSLFDLFACDSVTAEDTFEEIKSGFLEHLKQLGVYVDNLDGSFTSPRRFFSQQEMKKFVEVELGLAKNRLKHMKRINERVDVEILKKLRKRVKGQERISLRKIVNHARAIIEKRL